MNPPTDAKSPAARPELSVIVASHNRRELLRRCLGSLAHQDLEPERFEVIVADDGSDDGTAEMLRELDTPYALRALSLAKAGKAAALNVALREAQGDVYLFLDDDVIASPQLVSEHLAAHRRDPDTLAIGKLIQRLPSRGDPYARSAARRWNLGYEELAEKGVDWADCYGANFSAPRATLLEVGGFASDLPAVEDLELAFRLCRAGCVARYLPGAEAVHDDAKPGRRILHHERRFGLWCADFVRANPETRRRLVGWFDEGSPREVALRRVLLGLRLSPTALARLGRVVPGGGLRWLWYGFVSRYAFWHGVKGAMRRDEWGQVSGGVPVLMYHGFGERGERDRYVMPRRTFAWQMRLLAALRYHTIGIAELAQALREQRPLPRRTVAITMDDGYADNFEVAFPILRRHGFAATIYLVSRRLGVRNDWDGEGATGGRPMLSVAQARKLGVEGFELGAHSRTHPSLPTLSGEDLKGEVEGSRTELESMLGGSVSSFAYPYGEFDEQVVKVLREGSFAGACTTHARRARAGDDPLLIPRIEVKGTDALPRFLRKLWLGGA